MFNSYFALFCIIYLGRLVLLSMISYHILVSALSRLGCCYMKMKNLEDAEWLLRKDIEWRREYAGGAADAEIYIGMLLLIYSISFS